MAQGYRNFDEDFDKAGAEVEDRTTKFTFKGEDFEVNLNVLAGPLLTWMESASKVEGIPKLLQLFLDEEDYARLLGTDAHWSEVEELVVWLAKELGDSGN